MTPYRFSSLPLDSDKIRLLRLLPSDNEAAPLHCELCNYSLQESSQRTHVYDALSYVWGDTHATLPIYVDKNRFNVTENLHAALLHLRDHSFERIIWVDAICINQKDKQEKEQQIRLMYKIYTYANCVIVWLGEEANDSDQALEELRIVASKKAANFAHEEKIQESVTTLLRRDWFQRIWVRRALDDFHRILRT